jgi:hypothetical protein
MGHLSAFTFTLSYFQYIFKPSNPTDLCTHYIYFALHGFEVIKIRDCQIRYTEQHSRQNIELLYHLTTLVDLNVLDETFLTKLFHRILWSSP